MSLGVSVLPRNKLILVCGGVHMRICTHRPADQSHPITVLKFNSTPKLELSQLGGSDSAVNRTAAISSGDCVGLQAINV